MVHFLAEYLIMMVRASDRWIYTRRNWFHIAVVVLSFPLLPNALALTRLARLTRLSRLLRLLAVTGEGLRGVRAVFSRKGLVLVLLFTTMLVLASAGALMVLEPETVETGYADALWWAIVTATTVGYGDIAPISPLGRVIGVLLMLTGIGLISTMAASITAHFVEQEEGSEIKDLVDRLDRIEDLLKDLRQATENPPSSK